MTSTTAMTRGRAPEKGGTTRSGTTRSGGGRPTARAAGRLLATALLVATAVAAAPTAARADEGDPPLTPAPRFLPGSGFGGYEVRTVHVGGTVHLTDVDPFFDEDDHCDLGVGVDLLLTVAPGQDSVQGGTWSGSCDGAHADVRVGASVDGAGDVTVVLHLAARGDSNFSVFDTGAWDELVADGEVMLPTGGTSDVHLDAGASSHAEGTADLTVEVG